MMTNKLELNAGMINPIPFTVVNKQGYVEYSSKGFLSEEEARRSVGNIWRSTYDYSYDGYYFNRKQALDRMQKELEDTLKKAEELKLAISMTKKNWKRVENQDG